MNKIKSRFKDQGSRRKAQGFSLYLAACASYLLSFFLGCGLTYADDAPLGRLFFTPEQRASLDLERLTGIAGAGTSVKLNGIVRNRASGKNAVWVNGAPLRGTERLTGISPSRYDPSSARVTTASGDPVEVKVGQITDRATGRNNAPLSNEAIAIHRKSGHGP
jgi:acylphosphatase